MTSTDAEGVKPGEGRVIDEGGQSVAVYRSPKGELQRLSAVCTHQGCIVEFNDAEQTWDCPCHGSRFELGGKVLNGPAVKPLKRLS